MLINLELVEEGEPVLIGAPLPTVTLWAKADGILSIMPKKGYKERCEITVVGIPKVITCMESMESLAGRVNAIYQQLGARGSFFGASSNGN